MIIQYGTMMCGVRESANDKFLNVIHETLPISRTDAPSGISTVS